MKTQFAILLLIALAGKNVDTKQNQFVTAANNFLDAELPKMEAAVTAKDRSYFASALDRVKQFTQSQGAKIESSPACAEAVSDFLIVGLCRISPPGTICEPTTFIPKFEKNLRICRAAAK
jgi:hypothetical protein